MPALMQQQSSEDVSRGPLRRPLRDEIHRDAPLPLYHQLKLILVSRIERGDYRPGDLIPGEQELQDRFGLSRTTVRQALREMELEGLVTRYRGRGTFVARPRSGNGPEFSAGLLSTSDAPPTTGWRVLSATQVGATPELAELFGVAPKTAVFRLERVRLADGAAVGHTISHVSPAVKGPFLEATFGAGTSLDYLRPKGVVDNSTTERVLGAVLADDSVAAILDVAPGSPLLQIRRVLYNAEGKPIEQFVGMFRGDRFQFRVADLERRRP
ncbi:MAG: GntR family transcriptional regulator [Nannocystaceae bacterium]|nr:GntR family transcriptional regulator [Myxococcales bacterium]